MDGWMDGWIWILQ
jgi:hypothetical protein